MLAVVVVMGALHCDKYDGACVQWKASRFYMNERLLPKPLDLYHENGIWRKSIASCIARLFKVGSLGIISSQWASLRKPALIGSQYPPIIHWKLFRLRQYYGLNRNPGTAN